MIWFVAVCTLIFFYSFVSGVKDGPNAFATIIASRSIKASTALIIASVVELISPFAIYLVGFKVASTVFSIASFDIASLAFNSGITIILSTLLGTIFWNFFMLKIKMPSSSTHSLIGSLCGAIITVCGIYSVNWEVLLFKVVLMMFLTPVLCFVSGFLIMKLIDFLTRKSDLKVNKFFIKAQPFNMVFLSFNHAFNDSQKSVGIVMLLSVVCFKTFEAVPVWTIAGISIMLALGTFFAGYNIIKTIGIGIYRVRPKHSFASQLSSSFVILLSSVLGIPVSSGQIVSSSVIGVGSAQKYKSVRWPVVKNILLSWLITLPATFSVGFLLAKIILLFM